MCVDIEEGHTDSLEKVSGQVPPLARLEWNTSRQSNLATFSDNKIQYNSHIAAIIQLFRHYIDNIVMVPGTFSTCTLCALSNSP